MIILALQERAGELPPLSAPYQIGCIVMKSTVISGQLFVGALAVQHHLDSGRLCRREDAPLRENACAAIRLVLMPGDFFCLHKCIIDAWIYVVRIATRAGYDDFHKGTLVDFFFFVASADCID